MNEWKEVIKKSKTESEQPKIDKMNLETKIIWSPVQNGLNLDLEIKLLTIETNSAS